MHTVALLTSAPGQPLQIEVLLSSEDSQAVLAAVERLRDNSSTPPPQALSVAAAHSNAKKVRVLEIDPDVETPYQPHHIFDCAAHVDTALGYKWNATYQAFGKAKARGEKTVKLRGFTLCFDNDAVEVLNVRD